jgi:DNA polymerase III sliding clamp (beta) subunit (PCNA family)
MRLTIENKSKMEMFVALFQLLKNWGSCLNLHFEKTRLYIQSMDKSHICLSSINISSDWFSHYDLDNQANISLDANNFAIMMNYALKHNKMEIKFEDESDPDTIFINLSSATSSNNIISSSDIVEPKKKGKMSKIKEDHNKFDHFFELGLIEVEQDTLNIPEVDYDVDFTMKSDNFSELISELMVFGSNLNIMCNEEVLEFNASGDAGKLKVNIPIDDLNEYAIAEGDSLDISYSLTHLGKMCLSTKLGQYVSLSISTEYPMAIKYDLGDNSSVAFYIAPKIAE